MGEGGAMPQLSLYLDESTFELLKADAANSGVSMSKYTASLIRDHARGAWPDSFWETYGAADDSLAVPDELSFEDDGIRPAF